MPARMSEEVDIALMGTSTELEVPGGHVPPIPTYKRNLKSRFEILRTIGEGTYGKVKLAIEKDTGEHVAIKHIKKQKISRNTDLSSIRREIQIMSTLKHPHIVNVREVMENKDKIILVMDYAPGGELYEYINDRNKLAEKDARRIFRQIVSAVSYCHQMGVVHRDLKLENIVLDSDLNVKIADFGLSNYYSHTDLLSTFCGSPLYASPEIVNGQPYYGPEVDCWSLGVVLYTLVYGAMPFDSSDFPVLRRLISSADYYEPVQPSEAAGLIRHLLTVNPKKRAKMSDIINHWWVNLGHKETPTCQPYNVPEVLKPISFRSSSTSLSSDSECESELAKSAQPLKSILKKPKLDCRSSDSVFDSARSKGPLQPVLNNVDCNSVNDTGLKECATQSNSDDGSKKVFDSEKKPARSILKRKGKFSGSDNEFTPNENGARNSESDTKENMDMAYNLSDIEAALDSTDGKDDVSQTPAHVCRAPAADFVPVNNNTQMTNHDCIPYSSIDVVPRRGILKKTSQTDQRKRWSACSGGSNSSADILDFSYDSSDEHYMNVTKCFHPRRDSSLSGSSSICVDSDDLSCVDDLCTTLTDENQSCTMPNNVHSFDRDEAREILRQALKFCNKS
ncbi:hypothetical protein FSP39_019786 [Pinctada imbricata]|uniref:Protein kinase domain-containing protein n=1 Tax=Pinctada imbricata TaxID=66713 RepID=A0AA88YEW3_PINIB|nr:hypothetical protein FSP39_019786 [Pinctada imbricata]